MAAIRTDVHQLGLSPATSHLDSAAEQSDADEQSEGVPLLSKKIAEKRDGRLFGAGVEESY